MSAIASRPLRTVIAIDAAACGLSGAALILDAAVVAGPVGLPDGVLEAIGLFLVVYAGCLALLAGRPALPRGLVWALVVLNVAWAVESLAMPLIGWADPNGFGWALLAAQAAGALLVADLQVLALRRGRRSLTA
jgi:hypothetical protein